MKKIIFMIVLTALAFSVSADSSANEAEKGKKVYDKYCVKCHGEDGSGSKYGLGLRPKPAGDLRTNRFFLSDNELLIVVNHGGALREMPNWQYVLTEVEAKDVAVYVRIFNHTPDHKRGERLFNEKCALCHASDGAFKLKWNAPDLDRPDLSAYETARTIRYGVHDTFMYPREGILSNAEISDIVVYIQGLKK